MAKIEISVNSKKDIVLSVSENETVSESNKRLSSNNDVKVLNQSKDNLQLFIGSGKYIILLGKNEFLKSNFLGSCLDNGCIFLTFTAQPVDKFIEEFASE